MVDKETQEKKYWGSKNIRSPRKHPETGKYLLNNPQRKVDEEQIKDALPTLNEEYPSSVDGLVRFVAVR